MPLLLPSGLLATALFWLPTRKETSTDAVTMLIVAPTLVTALLSVRAGSEIAEELTATLRPLIGAVGLLAAACAIGILANRTGENPVLSHSGLKWLWVGCSVAMLLIAVSLCYGATRIRRFIEVGRRASPRAVCAKDIRDGRALNPARPRRIFKVWKISEPKISPPDLWLDADEGEIVPWGWLDSQSGEPLPPSPDKCFWQGQDQLREELVKWVQKLFCYKPPETGPPRRTGV